MTIALLTDFGTRDPYVAAMKGVIASMTAAPMVDLSHDIAPFDVWEAAWFLRAIARYWTAPAIFVCVVDPGVGSSRRIVAVQRDASIFLAPDNGLLTFVDGIAHAVTNEALFLPNGSTTFHGRDRFAPVAAALANGLSIEQLGPRIDDRLPLDYTPPRYDHDMVSGRVIGVDRFGNVITDVEAARIPFAPFSAMIGNVVVDRVETSYQGHEPFFVVGSSGTLELSVAGGSAATLLQLSRGDWLTLIHKRT